MFSPTMHKIVQSVVDSFVDSLKGRYQKFVSDQFLKALLTQLIEQNLDVWANKSEENCYYNAGTLVFESILELECKAGGNGDHVAQDLARHYNDYIKDAENPKIDG